MSTSEALEVILNSLTVAHFTHGDTLLIKGTPEKVQSRDDEVGMCVRVDPDGRDDEMQFLATFFQHSGSGKALEKQPAKVLTINSTKNEVESEIVDSGMRITRVQLILRGLEPMNVFSIHGPHDRSDIDTAPDFASDTD